MQRTNYVNYAEKNVVPPLSKIESQNEVKKSETFESCDVLPFIG